MLINVLHHSDDLKLGSKIHDRIWKWFSRKYHDVELVDFSSSSSLWNLETETKYPSILVILISSNLTFVAENSNSFKEILYWNENLFIIPVLIERVESIFIDWIEEKQVKFVNKIPLDLARNKTDIYQCLKKKINETINEIQVRSEEAQKAREMNFNNLNAKQKAVLVHTETFINKTIQDSMSIIGAIGYEPFRDLIINELDNFYDSGAKILFLRQLSILLDIRKHEYLMSCHRGEVKPAARTYKKILEWIADLENDTINSLLYADVQFPKDFKNNIFISYSHKDLIWLNRLKRHLRIINKSINYWDDSLIQPGDKWKEEIEKAISQAKIGVLLVSPDFLCSDFIIRKEVPPLLKSAEEGGCKILSVILKPCLFDEFNEINKYQTVNSPDKSIIEMSEAEEERTWIRLIKEIKLLTTE